MSPHLLTPEAYKHFTADGADKTNGTDRTDELTRALLFWAIVLWAVQMPLTDYAYGWQPGLWERRG